MKRVLIDSSSAILLFKGGLFDRLLRLYRVLAVASVYRELTAAGHSGAAVFHRLGRDRVLQVLALDDAGPAPACKIPDPAGLDPGERDTIRQYIRGQGDFIMIDDGRGAGYCRRHAIPYINALLFPRLLYIGGHMTRQGCRAKMDCIFSLGRYSPNIMAYALRCRPQELAFFKPEQAAAGPAENVDGPEISVL
jgi:hypothetical protein